jgi:hypothetical protein
MTIFPTADAMIFWADPAATPAAAILLISQLTALPFVGIVGNAKNGSIGGSQHSHMRAARESLPDLRAAYVDRAGHLYCAQKDDPNIVVSGRTIGDPKSQFISQESGTVASATYVDGPTGDMKRRMVNGSETMVSGAIPENGTAFQRRRIPVVFAIAPSDPIPVSTQFLGSYN